jgi:hypothetical protein
MGICGRQEISHITLFTLSQGARVTSQGAQADGQDERRRLANASLAWSVAMEHGLDIDV